MIIEFLGTQGAGKTTLLPLVIEFLRERGMEGYSVVDAARPFVVRTTPGNAVSRLCPPAYRPRVLWQVFLALTLGSRVSFCLKHAALIRQVLSSQAQRPRSAFVRERRVMHWFAQLTGRYEFLSSHMAANEALVFDDGFVHRAVHLHASPSEIPDLASVVAYLDLVPRPDVLIVPGAPLDVCEARVRRRGVWPYLQGQENSLCDYLGNSAVVVQASVDHLKRKGWTVVEVNNEEDDLTQVSANLREQLKDVSLHSGSTGNPDVSTPLAARPLSRIPRLPRPAQVYEYARSRSRSVDIDVETVHSVLEGYGLTWSDPPLNLPLSRRTRNVVVQTSAGRKVLKRYRTRFGMTAILYGHSILEHLAEINFPAARLVSTATGETYVSHGGSNYAVFDFVEGTNYSLSYLWRAHYLLLMEGIGCNLASLHLALRGFVPKGQHHLGFTSYEGNWQRDLLWYAGQVEELRARSRDLPYGQARLCAAWMAHNSGGIVDALAELDAELRLSSLPRQIIHGDYGLHNVVFQKSGTITTLDFELSRLEWRLTDLVLILSRLRQRGGEYDLEGIRRFLHGYQSVFPIPEDEWGFIPLVWRFHKLRASLISWSTYFESGGTLGKLLSAREALNQANWARLHPERLLELWPAC